MLKIRASININKTLEIANYPAESTKHRSCAAHLSAVHTCVRVATLPCGNPSSCDSGQTHRRTGSDISLGSGGPCPNATTNETPRDAAPPRPPSLPLRSLRTPHGTKAAPVTSRPCPLPPLWLVSSSLASRASPGHIEKEKKSVYERSNAESRHGRGGAPLSSLPIICGGVRPRRFIHAPPYTTADDSTSALAPFLKKARFPAGIEKRVQPRRSGKRSKEKAGCTSACIHSSGDSGDDQTTRLW